MDQGTAFSVAKNRSPRTAVPSYSHPRAETLLLAELKPVSRSFYKTLQILPRAVRRQIGLAYLLARISDTIADSEIVPVTERIATLTAWQIALQSGVPLDLSHFAGQPTSAEQQLLSRSHVALQWFTQCPEPDRTLIQDVLATITSGQQLDLQRFNGASANQIIALQLDSELDDYTYRVAGCVGEFWTRLAWRHLLNQDPDPQTIQDGTSLGKGLQLINILRDLPQDLLQGRCYLPATVLANAQLPPEALLRAENEARFRPVYEHYLGLANHHLRRGWRYTLAIPWSQMRLRLACAWPALIGMQTLNRLRVTPILGSTQPIKITRVAVRGIITRSLVFYPLPFLWRRLPGPF
jgi:farnesyl-diphosphate farnesyltransferase